MTSSSKLQASSSTLKTPIFFWRHTTIIEGYVLKKIARPRPAWCGSAFLQKVHVSTTNVVEISDSHRTIQTECPGQIFAHLHLDNCYVYSESGCTGSTYYSIAIETRSECV